MNTPSSLLGVLFDHTIGNILRMLAVIRLPKLERGRVSRGFVATLIVIYGIWAGHAVFSQLFQRVRQLR